MAGRVAAEFVVGKEKHEGGPLVAFLLHMSRAPA
jgi:hypothetical protein